MAEQYVINESYGYSQTASPSEMTPLVSSAGDFVSSAGNFRNRIGSVATALNWEKLDGEDEYDHEVS